MLGVGRTKRISLEGVKHVTASIGMQQSKTMTQSVRGWYDIEIEPKVGRTISAVSGISNKREAEWFADQLENRIVTGA